MQMMFWISFGLLVYAFIGYPLCLRVMVIFRSRTPVDMTHTPYVSLILSVYNEEAVIRSKIENFLASDYPADKLEFLIVSDGCEDRTEEIVRSLASDRIRLFVQPQRGGKTLALNRGAVEARGEILAFTDANALFDPTAIRCLVRHFADPSVGLVSGTSVYYDELSGNTVTTSAYRRYEDMLKLWEGYCGGIIGADGAIYALRKRLYEPLVPEHINDLIHPIQVVLGGYTALQDNDAICREPVDEGETGEMRRQTRIMAQSWRIFCSQIGGLVARGRVLYAVQLFSHKFLRWLTLPILTLFYVSSLSLLGEGGWYQAGFAGLTLFFVLGVVGTRSNGRIPQVAYLFLLMHYAAITGLVRYLRGTTYVTWNPRNN